MSFEFNLFTVPRVATPNNPDAFLESTEEERDPHPSEEPMYELVQESEGWYRIVNQNGEPLSPSFYRLLKPKNVIVEDRDQDGDQDLLIQYKEGIEEESFNMTSDFLQIPLNADRDSAITAARLYWVEDTLPDPKGCLDPFERLAHFQMQAGVVQLLDSLNKYFEVLGVESQNVQVATSGMIEDHSRNFSKFLTESSGRSGKKLLREIETIEGAELWSRGKLLDRLVEQQKQCRPLIAKTRKHIEAVQEQWESLVKKARCVAKSHENEGAGIGVAIDTATAPENYVTVTDLVVDGPAHKRGLQIGDQIIAVDGKSLDYLMHQEGSFNVAGLYTCLHCGWYVTHAIAGPIGSTVTLDVLRDGRKKEIKIPRQFELSALRFAGLVP